jgi:hypothetical protein
MSFIYRIVCEDAKGNVIARIDAPSNEQAKVKGAELVYKGKVHRWFGPYKMQAT